MTRHRLSLPEPENTTIIPRVGHKFALLGRDSH